MWIPGTFTMNTEAGCSPRSLPDMRVSCVKGEREASGICPAGEADVYKRQELDVSEVDYLAFNLVFRTEEGEGDVGVLMQDMVLTSNPNPLPEKEEIGTKIVDLKATNSNDGFVQISSHARTDVLGNVYSPDNLLEVSVNGNTAWGNNGYDEDRTAFAEYCIDYQYNTDVYKRQNISGTWPSLQNPVRY